MLQLDNKDKYTGKYKRRLKIALDVGCAIKGQHVDMHQGIGPDDDHSAVYYDYYGRVWGLRGNGGLLQVTR